MSDAPLHRLVADEIRANPGLKFSPSELGDIIAAKHPRRFESKAQKLGGPDRLIAQLRQEVYANVPAILQNNPDIAVDRSKRPMQLFLAGGENTKAIATPRPAPNDLKPLTTPSRSKVETERRADFPGPEIGTAADDDIERRERALYAPLIQYLRAELRVFAKRINESGSSNRRGRHGNKWLHPDIVGMEAPPEAWSDLVRQCAVELPSTRARLVSLEVKRRLSLGTVREAFFQAVSNSLWANTAYLVATEVEGDETLAELRMLCSLHGVGYIALDPETPAESRVLIPARMREEIDWASADRLARENEDFRSYLDHVLNYLRTGKVVKGLWD